MKLGIGEKGGVLIIAVAFAFAANARNPEADRWKRIEDLPETMPAPPTATPTDPFQSPDFWCGLYAIFEKSGYGSKLTERAVWIVVSGGRLSFVGWPASHANGKEIWKGEPPAGAVALAHTHPLSADPKPSPVDVDLARERHWDVLTVARLGGFRADLKGAITELAHSGWFDELGRGRCATR